MSNFALVQIEPFQIIYEWQVIPEQVIWPNGNITCGVTAGVVHAAWQVVPVLHTPDQPSEFHVLTGAVKTFDGTSVIATQQWSADLPSVREKLYANIDAAAEKERLRHITGGAGQALIYRQKYDEVATYQADAHPDASRYPLLSASIGIDGDTLADVAKTVSGRIRQWNAISAAIETKRLASKRAVRNAKDVDGALTAARLIDWVAEA